MRDSRSTDYSNAITAGEILLHEFLLPLGISQRQLAREVDISAQRINQIIKGHRRVSIDTGLRLCRFFGLTEGYWLRAQILRDLEVAQIKRQKKLSQIKPWTT